ncbi:hypothetical protein B0H15DRAFT_832461 [Mycena belliarum]|uniref:Uncharacterized protein n=1 Tax=Mycena belliarum TaxID=1033014 RepID=A0AAD6XSR3_9AGAR|nr:hypothetical protein B0H15DRAFT_832461 [Mycena belliae]
MSSLSSLPVLIVTSNPSLGSLGERPDEREIDRRALIDISPDREELFASRKPTDEIRQALKLRTGPTAGHWLYQTKRRANVNFRDATARTSTLIHRVSNDENKPGEGANIIRRVLSSASLPRSRRPVPMALIENGMPVGREGSGVTVWGSFVLSTPHKLISPRPLGPTHILVVHTAPLSVSKLGKATVPRSSRGDATKSFPNMDIPINDLLFLLNVPNLVTPDGRCPLPRRLHKELPRALLRVPHLETIHELIVYLHTMNQAELFRKLVPEWMRDLIHPLPVAAPAPVPTPQKDSASIFSPKKTRSTASIFALIAPVKLVSSASSTYSIETLASALSGHSSELPPVQERTADSIARDIVESLPFFAEADPGKDELVSTLATLNALKANLEFLGYFGKAVWDELDAIVSILIRALVRRAAVAPLQEADN